MMDTCLLDFHHYMKVYKKDYTEYVYSDEELPQAIARVGRGYSLQRYKGLRRDEPRTTLGDNDGS